MKSQHTSRQMTNTFHELLTSLADEHVSLNSSSLFKKADASLHEDSSPSNSTTSFHLIYSGQRSHGVMGGVKQHNSS